MDELQEYKALFRFLVALVVGVLCVGALLT